MVGPGCVHQLTHPSLSRCSLWGSDVGRLDSSSKSSPVPHGGGKQRHDLAGHLDQGASRPPNRTRQCPYGCQSPSRRQEWGGVAGAVTPERQGKPAGSLSSLCIRPAFPSGSVALGIPARVPAPSTSLVTRGRRVLGLGYRQARSGASEAAPPPPAGGRPFFSAVRTRLGAPRSLNPQAAAPGSLIAPAAPRQRRLSSSRLLHLIYYLRRL